ncbi:neuronal acetylcholine receptor subunit alpha-10-like isoform X2 [Actinia tenebrosa]|uniref:Neuronal acetylcholine receptor subunit alpha-10-like isoform X2 n=1 Tax=Actinia tenebrosa TaxID=6105 RepID=A0A6P8II10_ACTTE|nr:neuronal acetylcholine receptor subunit alpha-10-like isoform X2 [Actinia tenebrosa]
MAKRDKTLLSCGIIFVVVFTVSAGRFDGEAEHKLIAYLFDGYQKDARPVFNKANAVHVTLDIAYSQLVDLDGKNQILSSKVWVRQMWENPFLTWDPKEYGNVTSINVHPGMVWKPDLVLYNNIGIGRTGALYSFDTKVTLEHNGKNSWFAPTQIQSICKIDITYFPFDTQHCSLVIGSWTYPGNALNLVQQRNQSDLSKYTLSGEWDLLSAPVQRNVVKYACCKYPYIDITYYIHVRRKVLFYLSNLILPSIVLTILTVFSFYLPPESGERVSLVITILLGLTVFMLVFTESVPNTSEVIPLIAKYTIIVMSEVGISLLVTCFVMRTYHKGHQKDVPNWVRFWVIKVLAPILRVKQAQKQNGNNNDAKTSQPEVRNGEKYLRRGPYTFIAKKRDSTPPSLCYSPSPDSGCRKAESVESNGINIMRSTSNEKLSELCGGMAAILKHLKGTRQVEERIAEWHFVATVLDSAFFWLFLTSMLVSTVAFYFQIPYVKVPL